MAERVAASYYDKGPSDLRNSLPIVDPAAWLTPSDAERLIGDLALPMNPREFLCFLAERKSLLSKADIIEHYSDNSGSTQYADIPLNDEWALPAWKSPHADLWFDGSMRVAGRYIVLATEYLKISFERAGVDKVIARYSSNAPVGNLPTGAPGRPALGVDIIKAEMRRRAESCELLTTVTEEGQALADWYRRVYPQAQHPTPKTVINNIRQEYRRLKADA